MSYIVLIIFLILTISRYLRKKTTVSMIMAWIIFSPYIKIGTKEIDSSYVVAIVLFIIILLFQKKIKTPPKLLRNYLLLLVCVNMVYLIAWIVFSRTDLSTLISALVGSLKIFIIILECWIMNSIVIDIDIRSEISKMIGFVLVLNVIFVIYEMTNFDSSIKFLSDNFLSQSEQRYLNSTTKWGHYSRYYGLFHYPMHMGVFITYAITYLMAEDRLYKKYSKFLLLILAIFLGIMSASKSFIMGTAAIIVVFTIVIFFNRKIQLKKILLALCSICIILSIFIFFDQIYEFIYIVAGPNIARYFNFLRNFSEIFETRFSSETGVLTETILCIKQYWLIGVGPSSIRGELVMDNAFLMIMHNGGIVALIMVMTFYVKLIRYYIKQPSKLFLVFATLIMGMGFQTLIGVPISTWIIYELCTDKT